MQNIVVDNLDSQIPILASVEETLFLTVCQIASTWTLGILLHKVPSSSALNMSKPPLRAQVDG